MSAFVDTSSLLVLVVKASAVIGVAALADRLLRRRASAATRHWVWTLAVAGMLALPALSLMLPAWTVAVPSPLAPTESRLQPRGGPAGLQPEDAQAAPQPRNVEPGFQTGTQHPSRDSSARSFFPSTATLALSVYLLGLVLLGTRLSVQQSAARGLIRSAVEVHDPQWASLLSDCAARLGIRRHVRLVRSHERSMPMAIGVRTGVILIPSIADTWTSERRRAVLLHELAHVGRHDCLTQLLAQAACALYWPHPGVWWAARRLRVERELACDDRVLRAGTEARDYAGHLLEIAYDLGSHHAPALAVSMARPGQLEGRMLAVLDAARNRATPGVRARLFGTLAAIAVLLPLAVIVATAEPLAAVIDEVSTTDEAATAELAATQTAKHLKHQSPKAFEGTPQATSSSPGSGAWTLQASDNKPGMVYLEMREEHSSNGNSVPLSQLEGLSAAQLSTDGPVRFAVRRDAGTFNFEGTLRHGAGGGVYSFSANPAFPGELEKRGVARPTAGQQYDLARHDVGLALVDELSAQGYQKPTLDNLIQSGHHGVRVDFVREMGQLGYKLGTIEALIKLRDHGVSPTFVRELAGAGYTKLSADELVRARDHGVSPEFVKQMRDLGFGTLTMDQLVNARDHGVSGEFARDMAAAGYKLSLEEMIKARDHGVGTDFMKEMAALGYGKLSLDELVNARDHGVSSSFAKEMAAAGYANLPLAELINARDHGISAGYVKEMAALGYTGLPLSALVNARDHGVSAEFVRGVKALGYDTLPLDEVIRLRDHGVTPEKIKRANEKAGTKLPLDMVRSMVDGGLR